MHPRGLLRGMRVRLQRRRVPAMRRLTVSVECGERTCGACLWLCQDDGRPMLCALFLNEHCDATPLRRGPSAPMLRDYAILRCPACLAAETSGDKS